MTAPRLVFHLGAGGPVGSGHLARCRAVAIAAQARGWTAAFVIETSTPTEVVADPAFVTRLVATRSDALAARRQLADRGTVIVCDLPDRVAPAGEARATPVVLLNGDPLHPAVADLVFLRGATSQDLAPHTCTGFAYEVVRPEIRRLRPAKPWARDAVERIVVSFGASDPGEQTEAFLQHDVALPALDVVVGPGVGDARAARLTELVAGRGHVIRDAGAFPDLLARADCFVSVGGQSVLEALHLGRPVAAVRWGSLAADIDWLTNAGLVADLGSAADAPVALAGLLRDPAQLAQRARAGFEAIDGGGADRCLDAIATTFAFAAASGQSD